MSEFATKQARLAALLAERHLDGLLLQRASSFAWATCGASSVVNLASTAGAAALLVTTADRHLITSNLEAARLAEEEGLAEQGWQFHISPWYAQDETLARLAGGLRLASDLAWPGATDLSGELARLRSRLTMAEQHRLAALGADCDLATARAAQSVVPGQTEQEISARLAYESGLLGIQPITNIVAADERIIRYRHAMPTDKQVERYLMLVLNGRRRGLVSTVTRFVHFGRLPDTLRRTHAFTGDLFNCLMSATRPGRPLGEVLAIAQAAYASVGAPEGWREHHQGGAGGYEPREFLVVPGMQESVLPGQAFIWNPSFGGARSVDTFIIGEHENRIVSSPDAWPQTLYEESGRSFARPGVLVR